MNDFAKHTEQMLKNAQDMAIPEGLQKAMEDGLNQSRQAYSRFADIAQDTNKAMEKAYDSTQKGTKKLTDKLISQATENTTAAFETAEAILQTKSLPEAAKLQADYMKKSFESFSEQSKEIFELSSKIATDATQSLSKATTKAFEQSK